MTTVVGGLRARLIHDSVYACLKSSLEQLGWFDAGRQHKDIIFRDTYIPNDESIPFNTIALSDEAMSNADLELGSTAVESHWTMYLDFYAENDSIGKHLIHDVKDILGGRMSAIGRIDASVPVYDYRQATPTRLFAVDIQSIRIDRAHDFPKPWQKHWYSCQFVVYDAYGDELRGISVDGGTVSSGSGDIDGGIP